MRKRMSGTTRPLEVMRHRLRPFDSRSEKSCPSVGQPRGPRPRAHKIHAMVMFTQVTCIEVTPGNNLIHCATDDEPAYSIHHSSQQGTLTDGEDEEHEAPLDQEWCYIPAVDHQACLRVDERE